MDASIGKIWSSDDGAATVEFIVTLPVLLGALAVCYELGRAFLAYEIASADVQSAVRYLARSNVAACSSPVDSSCPAVAQAQNVAECGTPATCSAPHWPWNTFEAASGPTFGSTYLIPCGSGANTNYWCIQISNNGQGIYPFNQNVSVVQLDARIPMTLSLLGYIGVGKLYTMRIVDQAMLIGN